MSPRKVVDQAEFDAVIADESNFPAEIISDEPIEIKWGDSTTLIPPGTSIWLSNWARPPILCLDVPPAFSAHSVTSVVTGPCDKPLPKVTLIEEDQPPTQGA